MAHKYTSYAPDDLSTGQLHGCLLTGIAPRPIAFVSTVDEDGRVNLSPFSFFNIFGSKPPLVIFSPARRVRDNTTKHTLDNVLVVKECVVNIVDYGMVEQMSLSSTEYDRGVNEFIKSGLTQVQSDLVAPPRVGESPLAMECEVQEVIPTGQEGGAGNLVLARVIKIHLREDCIGENGLLDASRLDLVGRMGGSYYVRASGDALFEIPKPLREKGIGVDQLPLAAQNSLILTGNDLGRLGNLASLPSKAELAKILEDARWRSILIAPAEVQTEKQQLYVQELLRSNETRKALAVLFSEIKN